MNNKRAYTPPQWILFCCLILVFALAGCNSIAPAVPTTVPATFFTTETAVSTTSQSLYIELDSETVIAMLDEAEDILNSSQTLVLSAKSYVVRYIQREDLADKGIVSVTDDSITILKCGNMQYRGELRFVVFLDIILDRFADCYVVKSNRIIGDYLVFYSGFRDAGYNTVQEFFEDAAKVKTATTLWVRHLDGYIYLAFPSTTEYIYGTPLLEHYTYYQHIFE